MTLILGTVFRRAAVQVTDRLVTLTDPPGAPHDPIANKSVICCTSDGLFAVSYSGPAYIDKVTTTDTWLATTLWGEALPKQSFLAGAARGRMIDIGATLIRLRDALQKTYDRLPRSHPSFYVSAVGVQNGRVPRVAAYEIKDRSPSGPHVFEISKAPRDIPKDKFVVLQSPGGLLPEEEENLRREIRDDPSITWRRLWCEPFGLSLIETRSSEQTACRSQSLRCSTRTVVRDSYLVPPTNGSWVKEALPRMEAFGANGRALPCRSDSHLTSWGEVVSISRQKWWVRAH